MTRINANKVAAVLLAGLIFAGPAGAASNTPTEIANKKLVVEFYGALDAANATGTIAQQARAIAERFISPDYVQHREGEPATGNAREAFIRATEAAPPRPVPIEMRTPAKTVALMADGDQVIIVTSRDIPSPTGGTRPVFIFNLFRIANGKLAEHWDALPSGMTMPPPSVPGPR